MGLLRSVAPFVAALMMGGCDIVAPHECPAIVRPALVVWVRDSATGVSVVGPVTVVARAGAFADTADLFNPYDRDPATMDFNPFQLAFERAGTYDVSVQAAGYRPWTASAVTVTRGDCNVKTITLTGMLQRL